VTEHQAVHRRWKRERREVKVSVVINPKLRTALCSMLIVTSCATTAHGFRTPFGDRVYQSVERGLAWIRAQLADGQYGGNATAIGGLAILGRRSSSDWGAPERGYGQSSRQDKNRLRTMARSIINSDPALLNEGPANSYLTGTNVTFLSKYLATGGPDNVDAAVSVRVAIERGVDQLLSAQAGADDNACIANSWNYTETLETGDTSTTQTVLMGLSAATRHVQDALDSVGDMGRYLDSAQNDDGGFGYRACMNMTSTTSMTAAGINIHLLTGQDGLDPRIQSAMDWLRINYRYDDHVAGDYPQSYYYSLWAVAKALEAMTSNGRDGVWGDDVGGARTPAGDGFPEEPAGWYYDFAYTLVQTQTNQGNWPCEAPRGCWQAHAATAFSLLVLQRSLGGICGDESGDQDGICQGDDNCPNIANPEQRDRDNDGVGDVCDNCVAVQNGNQADTDGDGIGNVCDDYECVPSGPESCNGRDDDCDERFDEGEPGAGVDCNTGQQGVCTSGRTDCIGGELVCTRLQDPTPEECDNLDNNCDGFIDEGRAGGLRPCDTALFGECRSGWTRCIAGDLNCVPRSDPAAELCDGLDNDCDGRFDEGNPEGEFGCNTGNLGACSEGRTRCQGGALLCVRNSEPSSEICDSQDNDCDGRVDEDNPGAGANCVIPGRVGACGDGLTICQDGAIRCIGELQPNEREETCNGQDDDCDGRVDETLGAPIGLECQTPCGGGQFICSLGQVRCDGPTIGRPEFCDGTDNDCDGITDEDSPGTDQACLTGAEGVCADGVSACLNGQLTCVGNIAVADRVDVAETCDSVDDDCDGRIDEGNPEGGRICATDALGVCATGETRCINGNLACRSVLSAEDESCDGQDNDCDGRTDEDVIGADVPCDTGQNGICAVGVLSCGNQPGSEQTTLNCEPLNDIQPEICDGLDNDCDGRNDEGELGGGRRCDTGLRGACGIGQLRCLNGTIDCIQETQQEPEICDGADNDCDGLTDEDDGRIGQGCQTDRPGACSPGVFRCRGGELLCDGDVQAAEESCDAQDNDCDGQIDEGNPEAGFACVVDGLIGACGVGTTQCNNGALVCEQSAQPNAELCDGFDNDCDGETDEGNPEGGELCLTGATGLCGMGRQSCTENGLICEPANTPQPELCDGLDNDCDGRNDEDNFDSEIPCVTGLPGLCALGQQACRNGTLICSPEQRPGVEICNQEDDDCDGLIDEGLRNACGLCGLLGNERCNGIDDDCDGTIDEGQLCPGETVCALGLCVDACIGNECFDEARACVDGGCVDRCAALTCPPGMPCEGGQCVDLCTDLDCPRGQTCFAGGCVNDSCYETGCPDDELCLSGRCQPDPCGDTACEMGDFCRIEGDPAVGRCIQSCADVACPADQICREGVCQPDTCFDVQCPNTQSCDDGRCQGDCAGIICARGLVCFRGQCIDDLCLHTDCPGGEVCVMESGNAQCAPNWIPGPVDAGSEMNDGRRLDAGVAPTLDGAITSSDASRPRDFGSAINSFNFDGTLGEAQSDRADSGCSCEIHSETEAPLAFWTLAFLTLAMRRRTGRLRK